MRSLVCAVDVGTRSARAAVMDPSGRLLGRDQHPITVFEPRPDRAEHSSEEIWRAVCATVRSAVAMAGAEPDEIAGIAFDATCSLVVRDQAGLPLRVSPEGEAGCDTIVWLDHRAREEAAQCTRTGHRVLDFVGGVMSPEMQVPKAMWLKRNVPDTWERVGHLFDLADFLAWRATGSGGRSLSTLTCKWTYLAHEEMPWQTDFFDQVGLSDLIERAGLPPRAVAAGTDLGALLPAAAADLGLTTRCRVGAGLIDAYAGGLGLLAPQAIEAGDHPRHAALIAGTSSCVMAMTAEPLALPGFWGPFRDVTVPGFWMTEGGQSATGALLDHVIRMSGAGGEPTAALHRTIADRIAMLRAAEGEGFAARLHVLPDFHGNRSPYAEPDALGVISGLALDASFDGLCRLYWRTCVAIALGVRHILDTMEERGCAVDAVRITGGHTKSALLMDLYADALGRTVLEPLADESVLLGTAMVAATAAGLHPDLRSACMAMAQPLTERPARPDARARFDRDYRIFLEMQAHRRRIDAIGRDRPV
jgi:FGGY-family pentulose kinase